MGSHPVNLAVRFILELAAMAALGVWGASMSSSWLRFIWALAVPIAMATVWGVFAVPGDPSRSGGAPIPVPGVVRLAIELAIFGFATWTLFNQGHRPWAYLLGSLVCIHYVMSYDRIVWLLGR